MFSCAKECAVFAHSAVILPVCAFLLGVLPAERTQAYIVYVKPPQLIVEAAGKPSERTRAYLVYVKRT